MERLTQGIFLPLTLTDAITFKKTSENIYFLENWRNVIDCYWRRKVCLLRGMLLYVMDRICCYHCSLFFLSVDRQLNEYRCPDCRHPHLSKWPRNLNKINRNLVNTNDIKQKLTSYQINCPPYINCYWLASSVSSRTVNSWPYVGHAKKPIRDFPIFLGCAVVFHSRKSLISPACSAHPLLSFPDFKTIFPPQQSYLQDWAVLNLVKADCIAPVVGQNFPCWCKCGVWLFSSMDVSDTDPYIQL